MAVPKTSPQKAPCQRIQTRVTGAEGDKTEWHLPPLADELHSRVALVKKRALIPLQQRVLARAGMPDPGTVS